MSKYTIIETGSSLKKLNLADENVTNHEWCDWMMPN